MTTCVICKWAFEPEPYERELPARRDAAIRRANRLAIELADAQREAVELDAEIVKLTKQGPMAGLCRGDATHLHRLRLQTRWMGGRLGVPIASAKSRAATAELVEYLSHPDRLPGRRGSCPTCTPGSRVKDEEEPMPVYEKEPA